MEKKTIGKLISALRRANGMTQKELGERLFVSDKTISRWECDESTPDLSMIPAIAEIFEITTDELLRGEIKSSSAASESEGISEKGEKQLRLMLTRRQKRFQNLSLISVALSIVALLAAMMINLGFYEALIAFCVGAVFLLAGVILQIILSRVTLFFGEEIELYGEDARKTNHMIKKLSAKVLLVHLGILMFLLPLAVYPTHGNGLAFGFWLWMGGGLAALVFLLLYVSYRLFFRKYAVAWGIVEDSPRLDAIHRAEKRLMLRMGAVMLAVGLLFAAMMTVVEALDVTHFCQGETFDNYDDFVSFMKEGLGKRVEYEEEDGSGTVIFEDPVDSSFSYYPTYEVRDSEGNLLCEYPYNANYFAMIDFSFDTAKDGLPVTVYTKEAFNAGYRTKDTIFTALGVLLLLFEVTMAAVYTVKAVGLRKAE